MDELTPEKFQASLDAQLEQLRAMLREQNRQDFFEVLRRLETRLGEMSQKALAQYEDSCSRYDAINLPQETKERFKLSAQKSLGSILSLQSDLISAFKKQCWGNFQ